MCSATCTHACTTAYSLERRLRLSRPGPRKSPSSPGRLDLSAISSCREAKGPYPLVVFDHGDGPVDRTGFGLFLPIMERMLRAGYATFAWDKPGSGKSTGEIDRSRLQEQRTQILLDAIEVIKTHPDIDPRQIGLWGASQACYIMPRVLSTGEDITFMIAVSCPGIAESTKRRT